MRRKQVGLPLGGLTMLDIVKIIGTILPAAALASLIHAARNMLRLSAFRACRAAVAWAMAARSPFAGR